MGSSICGKPANFMMLLFASLSLIATTAYGLSCNNVNQQYSKTCYEILDSDASSFEKQQLIATLLQDNNRHANHDFISEWNKAIIFSQVPNGVQSQSNSIIKNAWLKIIAVMPFVVLDDKLLAPGIGEVLTRYNYRVEIPSGTESNDCKTEYSLRNNQANLNIYLNGQQIGNQQIVNYQGSGTLNFRAVLNIQTAIDVQHYKNYRYCCKKDRRGSCIRYCEECRKDKAEQRVYEINLEDSKRAFHYWPVIIPELKAIDKYKDTTVATLNVTDADAFELSFEDSSLSEYNYYYDINLTLEPYDVMTLRANKFQAVESSNLNFNGKNGTYRLYVSNSEECKLKFYDHFHDWEQDCNLEYNEAPLEVETDKLEYNENEPIQVSIKPDDKNVKISYGNEDVELKSSHQFNAKKNFNKISVQYEGRTADAIIHVKNNHAWDFALNASVFSGIIYSFYLIVRKYINLVF